MSVEAQYFLFDEAKISKIAGDLFFEELEKVVPSCGTSHDLSWSLKSEVEWVSIYIRNRGFLSEGDRADFEAVFSAFFPWAEIFRGKSVEIRNTKISAGILDEFVEAALAPEDCSRINRNASALNWDSFSEFKDYGVFSEMRDYIKLLQDVLMLSKEAQEKKLSLYKFVYG